MTASLFVSAARWVAYHLLKTNWIEVRNSLAVGVITGVIIYLGFFVYYCFKRNDLEEPPRKLSYRQRKKISEHLRPYGHSTYPVVSIYVCAHVADGMAFAEVIRRSLLDGGWRVDRVEKAECHSSLRGVLVDGEWKDKIPENSLPMSTVLQQALAKGGVVSAVAENPHGWMILCIGPA